MVKAREVHIENLIGNENEKTVKFYVNSERNYEIREGDEYLISYGGGEIQR